MIRLFERSLYLRRKLDLNLSQFYTNYCHNSKLCFWNWFPFVFSSRVSAINAIFRPSSLCFRGRRHAYYLPHLRLPESSNILRNHHVMCLPLIHTFKHYLIADETAGIWTWKRMNDLWRLMKDELNNLTNVFHVSILVSPCSDILILRWRTTSYSM